LFFVLVPVVLRAKLSLEGGWIFRCANAFREIHHSLLLFGKAAAVQHRLLRDWFYEKSRARFEFTVMPTILARGARTSYPGESDCNVLVVGGR
jgi:hypothetical protein